jgi:hypothetical protein
MQYARQLNLDELDAMVDDEDWATAQSWLKQGLGVGVYADNESSHSSGAFGSKHIVSYGQRGATIPHRYPPSWFGTLKLVGFLPAGTTAPIRANEGMAHLRPTGDGTWG